MERYARLYLAFAKNSFLNALEYRLSFTVWSIATICYTAVYVASIQIIFNHVQTIGGWRVEQMLVLAATVMIVDGIVESIFGENMNALSGLINRGELDFVLSKPVNTRFYVSTRQFDWDPLVQVALGGGVLWYAISLLAEPVTWFGALLYLGMVICACLIAYSLWFIIISVTFFVGRLNNVGHLYYNLIEASRVPTDVFRGALRLGLTFLLPVAFIATVPSQALLGLLSPAFALGAVAMTAGLLILSHLFWRLALTKYSSASS
jgi:ABC-2 type transport system permease protein